jgi:hypothetical protein
MVIAQNYFFKSVSGYQAVWLSVLTNRDQHPDICELAKRAQALYSARVNKLTGHMLLLALQRPYVDQP